MAEQEIFVYGSLTEGFVHYDKIKEFVGNSRIAYVPGEAYRLQCGYPTVVEQTSKADAQTSNVSMVQGQLLSVKAPALLLALLDQFHGVNFDEPSKGLHIKKSVKVILDKDQSHGGDHVEAIVYYMNPSKLPKTATKILGGVWSPDPDSLLPQKLSERQRAYILELGKAKGRDIVPINNLALYRELINLELIVDKGRRLALSKLGHEVFRYLN